MKYMSREVSAIVSFLNNANTRFNCWDYFPNHNLVVVEKLTTVESPSGKQIFVKLR